MPRGDDVTDRLQRAIARLRLLEGSATCHSPLQRVDGRAKILISVAALVVMLTVPLDQPVRLLLMMLCPIAMCGLGRLNVGRVALWSLVAVPFALAVGVFNPLIDHQTVAMVGDVAVSRGWITLVSLVLRAVISTAVVLCLTLTTGVYRLCADAGRLGVPRIFVALLLMVWRYVRLLVGEALSLRMAVDARRYDCRRLPLALWGRIVGRLLVRSMHRARRVGLALEARAGGGVPRFELSASPWQPTDTLFVVASLAVVALLRFVPLSIFVL